MLCRRVWQGAENAREATTLVRDLYDNIRERYEIGTTYAPLTLDGELWRDFLTVKNSRRYSATSYELWRYEKVVYDNRRYMARLLRDVASS